MAATTTTGSNRGVKCFIPEMLQVWARSARISWCAGSTLSLKSISTHTTLTQPKALSTEARIRLKLMPSVTSEHTTHAINRVTMLEEEAQKLKQDILDSLDGRANVLRTDDENDDTARALERKEVSTDLIERKLLARRMASFQRDAKVLIFYHFYEAMMCTEVNMLKIFQSKGVESYAQLITILAETDTELVFLEGKLDSSVDEADDIEMQKNDSWRRTQ